MYNEARLNEFGERFLTHMKFNEDQIVFISDQIEDLYNKKFNDDGEEMEDFVYDNYERDMWFTMNRSGLFEKETENKTGITNWGPNETRLYITEINRKFITVTRTNSRRKFGG